jgi:hypothetical protein
MSPEEVSDRLEIQDLFARYSFAIDDRDWDALDDVFTADAVIDYTAAGGVRGTLPQIKVWLAQVMARFSAYQHMVATTRLELTGDSATSRTILFNPMVVDKDGVKQVFFVGLWYRDQLVRTARGWRIRERIEQFSYVHNAPDMPPVPAIL